MCFSYLCKYSFETSFLFSQNFIPGCQNVNNVFNAKVPIIQYNQEFLNVECDISTASSGYHMSTLLYIWGHLDDRVRPLVFAVRKWASEMGLVPKQRPTTFFTNFPLTLMVIFYLQFEHNILPPLDKLKSMAGK